MKVHHIFLVDDQIILLEGIRLMINKQIDMQVVGTARNGQDACSKVSELQPDVILMDIRMPVMNGIEATKWIKKHFPATIILLLTTFNEENYIVEGLAEQADGYLLKSMDYSDLITTIRQAAGGHFMLPSQVAAKLAHRIRQQNPPSNMTEIRQRLQQLDIHLSAREEELIQLLLLRFSNKEIAKQMFISEGTVKNYISDIYLKLGVHKRSAAIEFLNTLVEP